ncbi:MAG: hypothetical protein JSW54_03460 [Fidelibacterota bacterium]|nr:MAG: hypothetical protein JSW54_03460 [Candidatus Neomarinimicrobiota bacterium]
MDIETTLLRAFESGLNPHYLECSQIPAEVLGYGEISTVFGIEGIPDVACKRMPLFHDRFAAEQYFQQYQEYCGYLSEAGLHLPEDDTAIIEQPDRPVVFYIAQRQLPRERFGHYLIQQLDRDKIETLLERIVLEIGKVWTFNSASQPGLELALDGQLSNWAWLVDDDADSLYYVDTSTPLYRLKGVEQLDPELFLQSAPSFLRWIIRWLFLGDVLNRYYDPRQVYIDLAANLYKEQRPDLVGLCTDIINQHRPAGIESVTEKDVRKYYREDKLIWTLFLAFRRLDRWIKTRLLRQRYEFILPGKIKR